MQEIYNSLIMTDLEMYIAAITLKFTDWHDVSLKNIKEDMHNEMLASLVTMTEKGLFRPEEGLYKHTELMEEIMIPVFAPDRIICRLDAGRGQTVIYRKDDRYVVVSPVAAGSGEYRVTLADRETVISNWLTIGIQVSDEVSEEREIPEEHFRMDTPLKDVIRSSGIVYCVYDQEKKPAATIRLFKANGGIWVSDIGSQKVEAATDEGLVRMLTEKGEISA